jgi:hypothetical protein
VTVPHMLDLAQRWTETRTDQRSPLWQQAHDLAGHMIEDWPTHGDESARTLRTAQPPGCSSRWPDWATPSESPSF